MQKNLSRRIHQSLWGIKVKVWIDQDLCTGDGLCAEIAPDVFVMMPDGLAYVQENGKIYAAAAGNIEGSAVLASFSDDRIDDVVEAADDCPGECIFIES